MPWGAAVGAVVSGIMSDGKGGGGAGTTTASKEPWFAAAPWLEDQIKTGQDLQTQYQQAPFNAQQLAAYGNMGRQTDYINRVVPDLLGQVSNQRLGFDRANPMVRPAPYTFNGSGLLSGSGLLAGDQQGGSQQAGAAQTGLLASLANPATVADPSSAAQYTSAANPPPPPPPPPAAAPAPTSFTAWDQAAALAAAASGEGLRPTVNAGLGSFKYGDTMPAPGTQAYLDMRHYLQGGGGDPYGYYNGSQGRQVE